MHIHTHNPDRCRWPTSVTLFFLQPSDDPTSVSIDLSDVGGKGHIDRTDLPCVVNVYLMPVTDGSGRGSHSVIGSVFDVPEMCGS